MRLKRQFWLGMGFNYSGLVLIVFVTGNLAAHAVGVILVLSGTVLAARNFRP